MAKEKGKRGSDCGNLNCVQNGHEGKYYSNNIIIVLLKLDFVKVPY